MSDNSPATLYAALAAPGTLDPNTQITNWANISGHITTAITDG